MQRKVGQDTSYPKEIDTSYLKGYIVLMRGQTNDLYLRANVNCQRRQGGYVVITAELTEKIEALSYDEYRMVETYVNNVLEYSKRRKKWRGKRLSQIWNNQKRE